MVVRLLGFANLFCGWLADSNLRGLSALLGGVLNGEDLSSVRYCRGSRLEWSFCGITLRLEEILGFSLRLTGGGTIRLFSAPTRSSSGSLYCGIIFCESDFVLAGDISVCEKGLRIGV